MPTPTSFKALVEGIVNLIDLIIPLIIAIVFLGLVWKIFDSWVVHAADEKKREEGKQIALTSVVVLVIMFIVWGVVAMVQRSLFGS